MNVEKTVLVTGGSGFIGAHCILQLAAAGYKIRSTVRDWKRRAELDEIFNSVANNYAHGNKVSVDWFQADLNHDQGWQEAVNGCDYVLHVASPVPLSMPKNENELINPAKEGSLRVLRAAAAAKVKRVVLTSSVAAVSSGSTSRDAVYTSADWANPDAAGVSAYARSKTYAERAAWDFIQKDKSGLELSVINPSVVFGPIIEKDLGASVSIIKMCLNGKLPGIPNIGFECVDVRDVAILHVKAMTSPKAAGKRFICSNDYIRLSDIVSLLKDKYPQYKKRLPNKTIPNFIIKIAALFSSKLKIISSNLGKVSRYDTSETIKTLDWQPKSVQEAIFSAADSLIKFGLIKKT